MFCNDSTELASALNILSISLDLATPMRRNAIHSSATSTSTVTMALKISSLTSNTSFIAAWFAPPPIQEPAIVVIPRHISSGLAPTMSGATALKNKILSGPPIITPTVPVKNMINAFGPNLTTSLKSMLSVKRINAAGSR